MKKVTKRLKAAVKEVEPGKVYDSKAGLELAQKTGTTKFAGSVEVHVRTNIDPKKTDQQVRGTVSLPHGTGKTKKVAAFVTEGKEKEATAAGASLVGGEELIAKIKETGKTDFDIAVAEPAMMPKLAQVAKILGTRGLMPNPKTGTVSEDIGGMIKEIAGGKISFKNDDTGNIHFTIGKTSFTLEQLEENFAKAMEAVHASRPSAFKGQLVRSVSLNATMGPGIRVKA